MPTLASRVTELERMADRRDAAGGDRVSELLRQARQRVQQGEVAPILHDVAVLTAEARLPGLRGQMARARLRLLEGPPAEGPLPVRGVPQDALGETESARTPTGTATRSRELYRP